MKYFVICISLFLFQSTLFSQSLSKATLVIDEIDVSSLQAGDKVYVPLRIESISDIAVTGFQLFVGFDHDILSWEATWETPEEGIQSIHPLTPMSAADWLFNDNGKQIVALWSDPKYYGVDLNNNELFLEIIFTYKGGLQKGQKSPLTWGTELVQKDGRVVAGPTEMYDANLTLFDLTLIDGAIVN